MAELLTLPVNNRVTADRCSPASTRRTFPPMQTRTDRMDAILAELTPKEAPEFLRAVALFERCGVLSQGDAEEWRKRFTGWVEFRFGSTQDDEAHPVS